MCRVNEPNIFLYDIMVIYLLKLNQITYNMLILHSMQQYTTNIQNNMLENY